MVSVHLDTIMMIYLNALVSNNNQSHHTPHGLYSLSMLRERVSQHKQMVRLRQMRLSRLPFLSAISQGQIQQRRLQVQSMRLRVFERTKMTNLTNTEIMNNPFFRIFKSEAMNISICNARKQRYVAAADLFRIYVRFVSLS